MNTAESERTTAQHEGGCLCGEIRYRVNGPIESIGHCHCAMCRRSSGALVVTWFTVATERFQVTKGELARRKSSANAERTFCPECGAQITGQSTHQLDEIDVTLGTLDHPERHPADRHIWASSQLPWLHLDEKLPRHEAGTPDKGG